MTNTALYLHLLKYLYGKNKLVPIGDLKSKILGYPGINSSAIFERLLQEGFASEKGNGIFITEAGKTYIEQREIEDQLTIECVVFDSYDHALIAFLHLQDDFVCLNDFPSILKNLAPQHGNSVNDGNLLYALFRLNPYIEKQHQWYRLTGEGKLYYEKQVKTKIEDGAGSEKAFKEPGAHKEANGSSKLPEIPSITDPVRIWLTEVLNLTRQGRRFTYRNLWTELADTLPIRFKPSDIDERLVYGSGEKITLLGALAVEGSYRLLDQVNSIIRTIRSIILENPEISNIKVSEIAGLCNEPELDISLSLQLARQYADFYRNSSYSDSSTILNAIDIGGSEEIFDNYLHFAGIESFLVSRKNKPKSIKDEYFSNEEIHDLNQKLHRLEEYMQTILLSQQFTYDDLTEAIDELRSLFHLKKKSWYRLVMGTFAEMTTSGLVGSLVSEPLADIIKPKMENLLQ